MRLILYFVAFFSTVAFADSATKQFYLDRLESSPIQITGQEGYSVLAEQVALLKVKDIYPAPRYFVGHNVKYYTSDNKAGELDIVVWDLEQEKVELIIEVKARRNAEVGVNEASEQLAKFKGLINRDSPDITMTSAFASSIKFNPQLFKKPYRTVVIGIQHADFKSYPLDLGLSRNDLIEMARAVKKSQRAIWAEQHMQHESERDFWKRMAKESVSKATPAKILQSSCQSVFLLHAPQI